LSPDARAQSIADIFRGKTLKVLVPSVPGGDRALYPLTLAPFLSRHIPGNPGVQPVFNPGAGGSAAVNYAYSVSAPDGLTLVTPLVAVVTAQAVGDESVKYDVTRFQWIGRITDATRVLMVASRTGVRTLDDLHDREVVLGAVTRASETYLIPAFMNKVFGTRFRIVNGYQSGGKLSLAAEAREIDAMVTTWNDVRNYHSDWLQTDRMRLLVQVALEKQPELATTPLMLDFAANTADRELITFMSASSQMGQAYAAPPGTPAPIIEALRRAFDETMKDPAFIEKLQSTRMDYNPVDGAAMTRIVLGTIATPKSVIDRYKAAVLGE
jgi:tripartite-type tricarboxylate transporter receptor subunit TctC